MNLRGYGDRWDEPGEHTLAEAASDVLAVADTLSADRFSLVGQSMGGTVIQRVLAGAPDRVRARVGISPVPASGVPFDGEGWALFSGAAADPEKRRAIIDLTIGNRLTRVWLDSMVRHSLEHSDERLRRLPARVGQDGLPHRDRGKPGAGEGDRRGTRPRPR